jgi:membrane associated rhomboid family serine protease
MFPIGDDNTEVSGVAFVSMGLIALNVLAFLLEINQPSEAALQSFIEAWGRRAVLDRTRPASGHSLSALEHARDVDVPPRRLGHLGGNMLFL